MTRTSREPTLALRDMKEHYTLWEAVMRCFWIGVTILAVLGLLRLMAWADTGMRGEQPIERSVIP